MPLFDDWAEYYDAWFETPIGALVREYEAAAVLDLVRPAGGEGILDAGCGTGVFTIDLLQAGARVTGLDLSEPMLAAAEKKLHEYPFTAVPGDMLALPFPDGRFDKAVSITALEFIRDGRAAVDELFRVTRPGGAHRGGDAQQPESLGGPPAGEAGRAPAAGGGLPLPGRFTGTRPGAGHGGDGGALRAG
jgi:ubiquinone/menaquinone biosynthesis C-methylase UbiE